MRWKRKDGNKWHGKERTPTKKQRKKFHRHLQTIQAEKEDKHGKPGSKAGPRREWNQAAREDLLNNNDDEDDDGETLRLQSSSSNDDEYGMGDALLDDLIGNTVQAAADPQPAPYTGHKHRKYFNAVADHMDDYRKYQQQQQQLLLQQQQTLDHDHQTTTKSEQLELSSLMVPVDLPSDDMIAKAVRAFRDKNGTRQRPVGLIAALSHVIQDMGVPLSALNEYSYNALLTCCRSPAEARRIFQMMREQQHHGMSTAPITAYSWTILADIYAKAGDFEGCKTVQQEMLQAGVPPTLASYTSLLAACYKVCIDGGRVPHRVRAQAAAVGWQTWQEMRIVGIEPDVMAYGAVLRLQAALGQPEACLNLLEEMPRFHVAPTALCFASALRAVARSHATAIRYEKGASRRNRRREAIAAHHGKLARRVLIQAESAGVAVHDDPGLVAALCLCAAAAGDAATAKAIYVASQICQQQQDSLRTIGSNRHLARLRGERATWPDDDASTLDLLPRKQQEQEQQRQAHRLGGSASSVDLGSDYYDEGGELLESDRASDRGHIAVSRRDDQRRYPSYGEREYGKDTRVLSAILHACAQAVDMNGIGTIWQGRENKGYLCANSLRLIAAPKIPQYYDNSIPGQKITDNLTWSGEHTEGYREGKRKSRKFEGVDVDEEAGSTLDELDEMFSGIYLDEDGKLKAEYRKTTPSEIWLKKYGDDWDADDNREDQRQHIVARSSPTQDHGAQPEAEFQAKSLPAKAEEPKDEMYFDYDTMRWKTRPKLPESKVAENARFKKDANVVPSTAEPVDRSSNNEIVEEMFFDNDTMRWKTRTKVNLVTPDQENVSMFANESDEESGSDSESDSEEEEDETENELYFDDNEKRWKTRFQEDVEAGAAVSLTKYESEALLRSSDSVEEYEDESIPVSYRTVPRFVLKVKYIRRAYCTLPVKQHPCYACVAVPLLPLDRRAAR